MEPSNSDADSSEKDSEHDRLLLHSENHAWAESPQWIQQLQPIPPEELPRATAPMVYEGFIPEYEHQTADLPQHSENPTFQWPAPNQPLLQLRRPMHEHSNDLPFAYTDNEDESLLEDSDYDDIPGLPSVQLPGSLAKGQKKTRLPKPGPNSPLSRGRGRRKRGGKKGPRTTVPPSEEFHALHAQATEALLDENDLDKAHRLILQAIEINPEIYSAHSLLSQIHLARGHNEEALIALFTAAHSSPTDAEIWNHLANEILRVSSGDRDTDLRWASYCFSRILDANRNDADARYQKAVISRELGHQQKALSDAKTLLKQSPHNSSVLQLIAEVSLEANNPSIAITLYKEKIQAHLSGALSEEERFTWADLLVYVDIVKHADGFEAAVKSLRDVARWLVGRGDEDYWTDFDDDREWDANHAPRRDEVSYFQSGIHPIESYGMALPLELRIKLGDLRLAEGKRAEALNHFEWLDPDMREQDTSAQEHPDLFIQVADALRAEKEYLQAFRFYTALHNIAAYDDVDFWLGIGACAYHCGSRDDAFAYYEKANKADPENPEAHTNLAKLHVESRDRGNALKHAKKALDVYKAAIPNTGRRHYERKELREGRVEAEAAYRKAYLITPPPGERTKPPAPSFSRRARERARRKAREDRVALEEEQNDSDADFVPNDRPVRPSVRPQRRLTKARRTRAQQDENVREVYYALCRHTTAMRDGDEEARSIWIEHAEALVDDFRSQKVFFPNERYKTFQGYDHGHQTTGREDGQGLENDDHEERPVESIESDAPNDYCGIVFSTWLDVFLEYALLLANLQYEPEEVYHVIEAAQGCAIWYHDIQAMTQIQLCYLVCALTLEDESAVFNSALRWFIREFPDCSDSYRLFSTINFYYPHSPDIAGKSGQMGKGQFRVPPTQKFLFRHLVMQDVQLPADYGENTLYGPVPSFMRKERGEMRLVHRDQPDTSQSNHISSLEPSNTPSNQQVRSETLNIRSVKAQEMNLTLLNLYGQVLYAGGTFTSALSYFYRGLSLDPQNPSLLLTIALCYMHELFKRTNDNRHMYFLQGWSFFEKYAKARLSWATDAQQRQQTISSVPFDLKIVETIQKEIELNRARCWQMNGMADLALRTYDRMLNSKPIKTEQHDDNDDADDDNFVNSEETQRAEDRMDVDGIVKENTYSMEAAYSMALIYAVNGDTRTARDITEKWLVIE